MGRQNKSVYDQPEEVPDDTRYECWPQFLQISPSYQLAHELWCGRASTAKIPSHVKDFDLVLETYEHFGDVFNRSSSLWWNEVASSLFAPQVAGLNWKVHKVWQLGEPVDRYDLDRVMRDYCEITRPNLGSPLTLLASIPLDMKYEDILNSLRQAFRYHRRIRQDVPDFSPPKSRYVMLKNETQVMNLELMLDLVHAIANKLADEKQYEVGFRVGVNQSLKRVHADVNSLNPDERTRINVRVVNLMHDALHAAENAARGQFCSKTPNASHFKEFDFHYLRNLPVVSPEQDELFAV
jgi:hypothetical protein